MEGASMLTLEWLLACASCLAVGLLAWALLSGASRRLPALRTRPAVWLAAQSVTVIAALLPFLPQNTQLGMTAPDAGPAAVAVYGPATAHMPASRQGAASDAGSAIDVNADAALAHAAMASRTAPLLAALWALVYIGGLVWAVFKLLRARRLWRGLLACAQRMPPQSLLAHGAFSTAQLREIARRKLTVLRTDAAISPMLTGVLRPRLLLPAHLDALTIEQQQMIIAHELHHLRARDPLCLAIACVLQTIFWFNPALRWMAKQMEWSLELQCDQHVLAGRPQQQRKQYAAALLRQWTTFTPAGAAAFGGATVTDRIRSMQQDGLPALSAGAAWLIAAALAAILALAMALQPALAYARPAVALDPSPAGIHSPDAGATLQGVTATPEEETWRAPLDKVRVTSFFGVMRNVLPTPHKGIDFGAAKGTPVHASASGIVLAAGPIAENKGRYGNTVIVDHGGQHSLYAHLDSVKVTPGQRLQAGQLIGTVGASGFATGPHLHLEVRENGRIIDPALKFTNLDAYATPRALKVRRQQKG